MSDKGDFKQLLARLREQGWRVEKRKKHYMAFPPDRSESPVRLVTTPSSSRTRKNEVAALKRKGYRP